MMSPTETPNPKSKIIFQSQQEDFPNP